MYVTGSLNKPGILANDLNGYKKKNRLDLPGLSPESVGEWKHDSTHIDTYREGEFDEEWLYHIFFQNDIEFASSVYRWAIEGSSIKIWHDGLPEGKLLPIETLTDEKLVYKDLYSPSGTALPTTIEEIDYLSR